MHLTPRLYHLPRGYARAAQHYNYQQRELKLQHHIGNFTFFSGTLSIWTSKLHACVCAY